MNWMRLKQGGLVTAIAALVMLTNLGGARLWDRDEPRNAGCAKEMLHRGDWVVPVFNGELRTHKPVLLYWCIMVSYLGLGVNEFAARLPSALCAIGSALCAYVMGRRLFGPRAGVWAGVALATSLMFVLAGRAATPDSLLVFCSTLAMTIYVCGTFRPRHETTPVDAPPTYSPFAPRAELSALRLGQREQRLLVSPCFPQHWPTVLAMYSAMGLGVLAKGPVGFLLPTAVIGLFLLIVRLPPRPEGRNCRRLGDWLARVAATFDPLHFLATCWSMRPVTAIFAVSAVALPWYWAVGLATEGEFLHGFFLEHNLGRATTVMEHHSGSVIYYPLAILVGFFPWSVFAVPLGIDTVLQLRRRHESLSARGAAALGGCPKVHAGYLLAVCWIGVYVVLFTLARTKLPSYVTPCYPALALLVGDYFDRWSRQAAAVAGRWLPTAFGCLAVVGVAFAVAVPIIVGKYLPGEEWLGLIGLIPIAGGVVSLGFAVIRSYRAAAGTFAATAVVFTTLLFAVGADRADRHQLSHRLFEAIYARSTDPQIASFEVLEPSWVFYGGRPIRELSAEQDPKDAADQAAQFLASSQHAFLITTEKKWQRFSSQAPPGTVEIERVPYFLRDETLVVVGNRSQVARTTKQPQLNLLSPNALR